MRREAAHSLGAATKGEGADQDGATVVNESMVFDYTHPPCRIKSLTKQVAQLTAERDMWKERASK